MRRREMFLVAALAALVAALALPEPPRAHALDVVSEDNLRQEFWAGKRVHFPSGLSDEQGLVYDSTTDAFRPVSLQSADEELSDVAGVTPTDNSVLAGNGSALAMETLTSLLDATFSSTRGAVLYRGAAGWAALPPGTATHVFTTGGAGADPSWAVAPGGAAFPTCRVAVGVAQEIASSTWDEIDFDASDVEVYDTHAFHNPASNPARLTIPSGQAGLYHVETNVVWEAHNTGNRFAIVYQKNSGGTTLRRADNGMMTVTTASTVTAQSVSLGYVLAAEGDYFTVEVNHTAGVGIDVASPTGDGVSGTWFQITRVAPSP